MTSYTGNCFCGAVEVEVKGEPAAMAICHCKLCRSWSAAPVTGASLWEPDNFKITKGEAFLGSFAKVEGHDRKWCVKCGGHVFVDHSTTYGLMDVYGSILKDFDFKPAFHVNYESSILAIKDGLPKFKDFPTNLGGSGDMLDE
jgi:hypothetical protein